MNYKDKEKCTVTVKFGVDVGVVREKFGYSKLAATTAASGNAAGISRYLFQSIIGCQKSSLHFRKIRCRLLFVCPHYAVNVSSNAWRKSSSPCAWVAERRTAVI